MNKNTIIGLLLIFGILIGSTYLFKPSKEELANRKHVQDSIAQVELTKKRLADSINEVKVDSASAIAIAKVDTINKPAETAIVADSAIIAQKRDKYGVFTYAASGENKKYVIENDLVRLYLSSKGGRIASVELKNFKTFDSIPLVLFNEDQSKFGFSFFAADRLITTDQMYFEPFWYGSNKGDTNVIASAKDSLVFGMRLYPDASDSLADRTKYIEFAYTLINGSYAVGFDIRFIGMSEIIAKNVTGFDIKWDAVLQQQEKSHKNEQLVTTIYYKPLKDDVDYISERKDEKEELNSTVKWISFKQQFFSATLIADEAFENATIETRTSGDSTRNLKALTSSLGVVYNSSSDQTIGMSWYFGPLKYKTLRKLDLDLEKQIPLGWSFFLMQWINRFAVIPVFNWLESTGMNYGIIILILTLLLKALLFPIAYNMYKSQAKMRVLKPEVEDINKKFPKKEDAMKKQQATMALYKKAGASPMAGCVPMLLQFPILLAMFRFFPASIELRQQSFLWATDLSSYDSILELPFTIPFYGAHVSLWTLLMTISTLIYTWLNNQMMSTTQQMPGMKTMMYLMPIMFLGFFNSYAAALSYYYFLANVITFGQMYLFRVFIDEDAIRVKIEENKKKPVTKSKFQQRLEDMAKQRGYQAPKR